MLKDPSRQNCRLEAEQADQVTATAPLLVGDRPFPRNGEGISVLLAALFVESLWLATRPYMGVVEDSRFYAVQVLRALLPLHYSNDLYFMYGSQDQFTLFTYIYEPFVKEFGLAGTAIVLTFIAQLLWVSGLVYFVRALVHDRRVALVAIAMTIALPSGVVFDYGEQFLTPRLFAEAMSLWALGLMLRGQSVPACLVLTVSATFHPIMTVPGIAAFFLFRALEKPRWLIVSAAAAVAVIGAAALDLQPFSRLLEVFDKEWIAVVRVRDSFALMREWSFSFWIKLCNLLLLAALGCAIAEPRERRLLGVTFTVGIGGILLTFVGGDLLRNVLIVDAQQYRATWLLTVVANMLAGAALVRTPWSAGSRLNWLVLSCALGVLGISRFVPAEGVAAPLLLAMAVLVFIRRQKPLPALATFIGSSLFGIGLALTLFAFYVNCEALRAWPYALRLTVHGFALTALAFGVLAMHFAWRQKHAGIQMAFAASLVIVALISWDQRSPWTKFVEGTNKPPASLSALLPESKQIYWEGDVRVPWFLLRRSSYFSCAQGTGSLFFRGTAITYKQRYNHFGKLETLDFGQQPNCPTTSVRGSSRVTGQDLSEICASEPELGALVLTHAVANVRQHVWTSPVPFEVFRTENKRRRLMSTDKFFVYRCSKLMPAMHP